MSSFDCNPDWPICIYDFTFKNRNPNYLTFKVKNDLTNYVTPNHFKHVKKDRPKANFDLEPDSELLILMP